MPRKPVIDISWSFLCQLVFFCFVFCFVFLHHAMLYLIFSFWFTQFPHYAIYGYFSSVCLYTVVICTAVTKRSFETYLYVLSKEISTIIFFFFQIWIMHLIILWVMIDLVLMCHSERADHLSWVLLVILLLFFLSHPVLLSLWC